MKTLWNSRTALEYRMPLLYFCSTSFSSYSFIARSRLAVGGPISRGGNTTVFDENKCGAKSGPSTENTREKGCDIGYVLATGSLRRSRWRGDMHRHSPLMRSLLSQSQTPTTPRRAVGFFRFGCPAGCPAELITQSTSDWLRFISANPFDRRRRRP